jgi:peptide chain release factor 2
VRQRVARLEEQVSRLRDEAAPLMQRKSELMARSTETGFWDNRAAAQSVFDEVYRIDGVLTALDNLVVTVSELTESIQDGEADDRELGRMDERLDGLEGQTRHVAFLVSCRNPRDLGDAFVVLTLVTQHGDDLDGVGTLARMYVNLAQRHNLEVEVLDDRRDAQSPGSALEDIIVLMVSGAGAYALLAGEAGLHQVSRGKSEASEEAGRRVDRDVVRVEVLPVPEEPEGHEPIHVETRSLHDVKGRLLPRPRLEVVLRHEPSLLTLRAWSERSRNEAVERLRPLLRARVVAAGAEDMAHRPTPVVRRYSLGPAPLVRDVRSGRSTGRLDLVLQGQLDIFLGPRGEA